MGHSGAVPWLSSGTLLFAQDSTRQAPSSRADAAGRARGTFSQNDCLRIPSGTENPPEAQQPVLGTGPRQEEQDMRAHPRGTPLSHQKPSCDQRTPEGAEAEPVGRQEQEPSAEDTPGARPGGKGAAVQERRRVSAGGRQPVMTARGSSSQHGLAPV